MIYAREREMNKTLFTDSDVVVVVWFYLNGPEKYPKYC